MYHTVPGKCPWGIVQDNTVHIRRRSLNGSTIPVQAPTTDTKWAPKIEDGRLHGGGVWMVQLSPCKHPLCAKDVVLHKVHQNDCSYLRELSGLTFSALHKNKFSTVGGYTEDLQKPQNWRVGTCPDNIVRAWLETPPYTWHVNLQALSTLELEIQEEIPTHLPFNRR